jgi:hypothetical protein
VPIWGGLPGGGGPAAGALNAAASYVAIPKRPLVPPGTRPNGTVRYIGCPRPAELRKLKKDLSQKHASFKIWLPVCNLCSAIVVASGGPVPKHRLTQCLV